MKFLAPIFFFCAFSVVALTREEVKTQMLSCLREHSADVSLIETDNPFGREFDRFSEKLCEISEHGSLQLSLIPMFFFRAVCVGLIEKRTSSDVHVFEDAYAVARLAVTENLRHARFRLLENRLPGEKKLNRTVLFLLSFLTDLSPIEVGLGFGGHVVTVGGDALSDFSRSFPSTSPSGSDSSKPSGSVVVKPVPRLSFRRCVACDSDATKNTGRESGRVLRGAGLQLFGWS